ATSESSHHHELGRRLARDETQNICGEGPHTLKMIKQHQLINTQNYPLLQLIDTIAQNPHNIRLKFDEYLEGPSKNSKCYTTHEARARKCCDLVIIFIERHLLIDKTL
ncbi:hypothetical protein, partial [Nitrosomonas sp.]|uniref:hypothetical protein n=1 Tax=Nitrosomonas sp. TaxID=42353 RepID=UPI0027307A3D